MNATTYGLDVAKRVLQMYWVDPQSNHERIEQMEFESLDAFAAGLHSAIQQGAN